MKKGFTFIEILIVLTAIITLIGISAYFLKPVEIFKRNRDFQRINDLKTLELAINTYLVNSPDPKLGGNYFSTGYDESRSAIYISIPYSQPAATSMVDGANKEWQIIQNASDTDFLKRIDGTGWLPINFTELKYPPLSYLPFDPINRLDEKYFYTYAFSKSTQSFELNARFESNLYKFGGGQDKSSTDGGSDNELYEVGTNKCLIIGNKLYGEISTSTCVQVTTLRTPPKPPASSGCERYEKITSGQWLLFDENGNLIATDTSAVHDGSTSTSLLLGNLGKGYIAHKHPYYFIYNIKVYSDYDFWGGNKPYIKYYKNATWTLAGENETRDCGVATTTYINTTTEAWAVGWGTTVRVCEMEAYGCPIELGWFVPLGSDFYLYDIKLTKENFWGNFYVAAGVRRLESNYESYYYPWWVKIDDFGKIVSSSTIIINASSSYFRTILPLDENKDNYIDHYLFGGEIKIGASSTALVMKVSSTSSSTLQIPDVIIYKWAETDNGNYLGVGKSTEGGYTVLVSSSTLNIVSSTTISNLSTIYDIVPTMDRKNFLVLAYSQNGERVFAKIDSDSNVIASTSFTCFDKAISIKKIPYSNLYAILARSSNPQDGYYFYTINIDENLNINSISDIWNTKTQLVQNNNLCGTTISFWNFRDHNAVNDFEFDRINNTLVGIGRYDWKLLFVTNGILKYPMGSYLKSTGDKIISISDNAGYVITGYDYTYYGQFIMTLNRNGDCKDCFASIKKENLFANIFKMLRDFHNFILYNLRFPP